MLKTRVIPTLLWKNVGLVKGEGFNSWRRVGTVTPSIKVYNTRDVDELILVDISAMSENREPDYSAIEEFASECFVPFCVGGGIQNLDHIRKLLLAGADKVCINSAAYENPDLIAQGAKRFGSQCIVVSIDAKKENDGSYLCYSHAASKSTGKEVLDWATEVERLGAGEILLTNIERDGTMQGYDLELLKRVSSVVKIPVIASGGAGNYQHMLEALTDGKATAVAAAAIFHFTEQTPAEAKKYLASRGVAVRNSAVRG